ncbi:MAG: sigma-70 family RNA polymerase sigma factor [Alistipes sp.]|nr:sigma-70 family RNA polymerase sigma factor [Alistipes sp.]
MKFENIFNEIAEQYYNAIFKYCCVRLDNEHAAKDCTQEVFLTLYRKIDKMKLSENVRAWLYRTADNVMKNYRRKNKITVSIDDINETTEDSYSVETPFEDIITKEEYELLNSYYINGDSIETISKRLGISKDAVYQRIHRIKTKIEKEYMQQ